MLRVSASVREHILDGDRRGGGHRFGANRGESEFPQSSPDDDIIRTIEDLANDPAATRVQGRRGRVILIGVRNSVGVTVVINPVTGCIETRFPT
jgi:hypothetical protein